MSSGANLRERARELSQAALRGGSPTAWFETLYAEAEAGDAVVPWADLEPNPHLVAWLRAARVDGAGARALDVGCGYGDNAAELARRGFAVTAFDVSATAVAHARARFGASLTAASDPPAGSIELSCADLLEPPEAWRAAFDLVVEVYTLQVLPPAPRARAADALRRLVAPGGRLLVICRGRDDADAPDQLPWALTREEVEAIGGDELRVERFTDLFDDEEPPVRRFVVSLVRAA